MGEQILLNWVFCTVGVSLTRASQPRGIHQPAAHTTFCRDHFAGINDGVCKDRTTLRISWWVPVRPTICCGWLDGL